MAGLWIKIEHITPDKPEVFQVAERLGIDPDAVIGKLVRVWIWADQQTRDGNAPSVTSALLDRISAVSGFADAMESVGWLETTYDGVHFVNFDRHNGSPSKSRALGNQRVQKHREVKRECNGGSVTKALPEKRREEKSKKKTIQKKTYGDEFSAWWEHFPRKTHKSEASEKYPPAVAKVEKQQPDQDPHEFLTDAAKSYARSRVGKDPEFTVNPATWLLRERWNDEQLEDSRTSEQRLMDYREATQ